MVHDEQLPGEPAQHTGQYEELNVLGGSTGLVIEVEKGDTLPGLPRGFTWRHSRGQRVSVAELLAKAKEYRRMAATATTIEVRDALFRVADRFAKAARERDGAH